MKFTVREFLLAYVYDEPVSVDGVFKTYEMAEERGLILLGGRGALEEEIRLLEAVGIIVMDDAGRLSLNKNRLHPETLLLYGEKAAMLKHYLSDS